MVTKSCDDAKKNMGGFSTDNIMFSKKKPRMTLVAETLILAKTHGYVEKIEDELERELQRDFSEPPDNTLLRWRRAGDKIFKSKHILLTVVILCIVDCALVLGELALDLYKVKATLEDSETLQYATLTFISEMHELYPVIQDKSTFDIFAMLLHSSVIWITSDNDTSRVNYTSQPLIPCSAVNMTSSTLLLKSAVYSPQKIGGETTTHVKHDVTIIGEIAHIFHYCSISILALIMVETFFKAVCAGKSFFHRKIEVFDAFVVVMSFLMDFTFLVFLYEIATKDFVFILAILLPWRVIRVVNSLIVSVKDHEHFRLKLVYKRKKKIQGTLRDTEAMLQKYMNQSTALQRLCIMEGIQEWKIDNYLTSEETSVPPTPVKKKFKFKFEEPKFLMQGHNRSKRCSMPVLDLQGLKLPTGNSTKTKMSLPSVANSIKHHISKNFPSRRTSLAAADIYNAKMSNGDVRRRKLAGSEDLCTMQEEESEHEDSATSSRTTSESGDVFRRVSVSESIGSDHIFIDAKPRSRNNSVSEYERKKLARIQEESKRRHSESKIDKNKVSVNLFDIADMIALNTHDGKAKRKNHSPNTNIATKYDTVKGMPVADTTELKVDHLQLDNISTVSERSENAEELYENNNEVSKNGDTNDSQQTTDTGDETNLDTPVLLCTSNDEVHFENEIPNGKIT